MSGGRNTRLNTQTNVSPKESHQAGSPWSEDPRCGILYGSTRIGVVCSYWLECLSIPKGYTQSQEKKLLGTWSSVWVHQSYKNKMTPLLVAFSSLARTSGEYFILGQDQSTMAQRAETTVAECSLARSMCARCLISFYKMPGQRHRQPTP